MTEQQRRKADLLAFGAYPTSKGYIMRLSDMDDHHLVNALLKAIAQDEPEAILQPLAKAVVDRGLHDLAFDVASKR